MTLAIAIIGATIASMSVLVLIAPAACLRLVGEWRERRATPLRMLAAVVRIAVGAVLVVGASATRYPLAVEILGWAILVLGVAFLVVSTAVFTRLLDWILRWLSPATVRVGGLAGLALGGFLVFAAILGNG